jgi:hypothetical protein
MPHTVAGLFQTRSEADMGLRKLKDAGFTDDQLAVSTPAVRRRGHYWTKQLAGLVLGTVLGGVLGLILGLFAMHRLPGNPIATLIFIVVAGAVTGGVAGGLFSMSASGDRALHYEQEVESGRVLVSVAGPRLEEARAILLAAGAMEAAPVEAPMETGRPKAESG